jgi:imidazole glycerol-phosphate synthase subunit HisH
MPIIAIIDYGMGNLRSVQKGIERVGFTAEVTRDCARITAAAGVVLPGVGAFGACMENLRLYGLVDTVRQVIQRGTPFLGICLGMQLLFDESEEFGRVPGLGVFPGRVVRFQDRPDLKVPHMGWNQIRKQQDAPHLRGIDDGAFVYFVHSYYVVPADPSLTATSTDYGVEFTSAIAHGNVFATQYHPEKSQAVGLQILRNFGELVSGQPAARHEQPAPC